MVRKIGLDSWPLVEEMPAKLIAYTAHLSSVDGDGVKKQIGERMGKCSIFCAGVAVTISADIKRARSAGVSNGECRLCKMETVAEYVEVLQRDPEEVDRPFKELSRRGHPILSRPGSLRRAGPRGHSQAV